MSEVRFCVDCKFEHDEDDDHICLYNEPTKMEWVCGKYIPTGSVSYTKCKDLRFVNMECPNFKEFKPEGPLCANCKYRQDDRCVKICNPVTGIWLPCSVVRTSSECKYFKDIGFWDLVVDVLCMNGKYS